MSARRFSVQAAFVVTRVLRLFLAQADGFDLVILDAEQGQRTLDGFGTLLTERQVVFAAATLVGITLDQHLEALVGGQVLGVSGDQILVLVLDFVLVEVEVDAALRQLALRVGQLARQAAGIETTGGHRGHTGGGTATRFDRGAAIFRQRGGGTGGQQGGQQGRNQKFFHVSTPVRIIDSKGPRPVRGHRRPRP